VERLTLPQDGDEQMRTTASSAVQLLSVLASPWCMRKGLVEWLGGSIDTCSDSCIALGVAAARDPATRTGACDSLSFDLQLTIATEAAAVLLRAVGEEPKLVTAILDVCPAGAPPPFDQPSPLAGSFSPSLGRGVSSCASSPAATATLRGRPPRMGPSRRLRCVASSTCCCCRAPMPTLLRRALTPTLLCRTRRQRRHRRSGRACSSSALLACAASCANV